MTIQNMAPIGRSTPLSDHGKLLIVAAYAAAFILFGFLVSTPREIFEGVVKIISVRDTLTTDYIGVGGMGAAFVNAGVLTLLICVIYYKAAAEISGAAIACLFLILGFGLFGKNILNIWFVVAGVWLYCKFKKEPFAAHINVAFFGAALAPVFSEILFSTSIPLAVRAPLSISTSLAMGFILPPAAANLFKVHMGFSLYNMGFAAGIVGVLVVALYKSYGFVPDPVLIWTTGNNVLLGGFLIAVFISLISIGFYLDRSSFSKLKTIIRLSGQSPCDFTVLAGIGPTFVNMGLTGFIGMAYILAIGGDLNGPTIGGVFTLIGFGAYGKHPRNVTPIMAGVFLGSLAKPWNADDPAIVLAALFGTTLAPIAGQFGWRWGVAAGFIHSSAALSVNDLHGGLSLYNNGFAAGIVAGVLAPVIMALRSRESRDGEAI